MKIKSFLLALSLLLLAGCTTDFDEAVRIEEKELNDLFARNAKFIATSTRCVSEFA